MRHRKAGYKLGRTTAHRLATLRNLAVSLFEHGQITTTIPRAKAVQPMVEKLVTLAKTDSPSNRRRLIAKMGYDRLSFDWLYLPKNASDAEKDQVGAQRDRAAAFFNVPESSEVERNRYGELRKAPKLVNHIFENIAPRFADRAGGYTRVVRLGRRRVGDAGEICVLQFVGAEEGPEIGGRLSTRRRTADKRTAYAAKFRKAAAAKGSGDVEPAKA
jgi:large subunit ribosomal protein L17